MSTNSDDMLIKIDSAANEIRRAMVMLDAGMKGVDDSGVCKCTMHHVYMTLLNALVDLTAAGAQTDP